MTIFEIFTILCITQPYISHGYQNITEQAIFQNFPESQNQSEIEVKDFLKQNSTAENEQSGIFVSATQGEIDRKHNKSQSHPVSNRNKRAAPHFKRNSNDVILANSRGHNKYHSSLSKRSNENKPRKRKKKKQYKNSTNILSLNTVKTTPFAAGDRITTIIIAENAPPTESMLNMPIDNKKQRPLAKQKSHKKKKKKKRPTSFPNIAGTSNTTELVRSDIGFLIESIKTVENMKNNGSVATKKNGWNVFISNEKGSSTTMENPINSSSIVTEWGISTSIPTVLMILENFTEGLKTDETYTNQEEMSKSKSIENDLNLLKAIMPAEESTEQYGAISEQYKNNTEVTEEKAKDDDIQVSNSSPCDYFDNNSSCWYEREVGDTLTLDLNITSLRDESAFVVRWMRRYHKYKQKQCVNIKLENERLPWNMVLGSANRELRIDPVTNTDMDPNSISAKIFLVSKKEGKKKYLLIKEMIYHIQIPAIDMGSLYPGEELNINLENFLTLPENGNFLFDWKIERPNTRTRTLPSNFKKSMSGRSVVVKEFKKAHAGTVNCVVYSSTRIAVAKRRFSINRLLAANERKRSSIKNKNQNKRTKRHRHFKRCNKRSKDIPEATALKLLESSRPISRKKRFRKTPTTEQAKERYVRDCKHHNRLHPRWIMSALDDDETTEDPRLMSVQKLVELSEDSDGTLDAIIPHEVHYVEPMVHVVTDYLSDFQPPDFQPNCSTDSDCAEGALCVIPQGRKIRKANPQGHKGYCYCKSAYFGDGFTCIKIPRGNHRDKRIRRETERNTEEFKIQPNLFYDGSKTNVRPLSKKETLQTQSALEALHVSPLVVYEDEDSYLVSECDDRRDCSQHAVCFQGDSGHPYCKCNPGYRGNGIFCWEMIDYIKDQDQMAEMAPD